MRRRECIAHWNGNFWGKSHRSNVYYEDLVVDLDLDVLMCSCNGAEGCLTRCATTLWEQRPVGGNSGMVLSMADKETLLKGMHDNRSSGASVQIIQGASIG